MTTKINITGSVLFKQVASVIGKVKALEELCKAYESYDDVTDMPFDIEQELIDAFEWCYTPQGSKFWLNINCGDPYGKYLYA